MQLASIPCVDGGKNSRSATESDFGGRYALIVSIGTPAEDVDIWTPVAQQVGVPVQEVQIEL